MTENDDNLAPINRPITDAERTLIKELCIACVVDQTGVTEATAANALEDLMERTGMYMQGDNRNVWVKFGTPGDGKKHDTLVHVTREWLSFYASHPDEVIDFEEHRRIIDKDDDQ